MDKAGNGEESDLKSKLVIEICSVSTWMIACSHKHYSTSTVKSHFIDWYRLIGVEEDAAIDLIRKRYHKLALQLHPDKNKHPRAEVAFKLVSEAYKCLTDNVRRRAFDVERSKYLCCHCRTIPLRRCTIPSNSDSSNLKKPLNPSKLSQSCRILRGLKEMRDIFKEEAMVIENCLRANNTSRKESSVFNPPDYLLKIHHPQSNRKESPVFNPSDYAYKGYPHLRTKTYSRPENFQYLPTGNRMNYYKQGRNCDFPIFDISDKLLFRSKSVSVPSNN